MNDATTMTTAPPAPDALVVDTAGVPTERLEAEICTLAGHLAAATCRWLLLIAEFDAREGWRVWEQTSCAGWLSWKCGTSLTTAHEHVRVARSLARLPHTTAAFAQGRISYAKVRAISRIATPADEEAWLACALGCTAAQLDRLAAACRKVTRSQSEGRGEREKLSWRWDDDGMLIVSVRLAPEHGARFLASLREQQRIAAGESAGEPAGSSAEDDPQARDEQPVKSGCGRPEALVAMADAALAHGPRSADPADAHQVVIHVDRQALAGGEGRCHLDDGPSVHPDTLRRVTCAGATAFTVHDDDEGTPLDVGRTTRKAPARLRRVVLDRAGGRCQYPGCPHKSWLQLHHVVHWLEGGPTSYANLCVLCSAHHRAHHAGRYQIIHDKIAPGDFRYILADGTPVEHAPRFPTLTGDITGQHDAAITPATIHPEWYGDPLELDYAVSVMTTPKAV